MFWGLSCLVFGAQGGEPLQGREGKGRALQGREGKGREAEAEPAAPEAAAPEAQRPIETLLDEKKPYRKQILKRSELMNLYHGRAQCYHIKQAWVKGEPSFKELLLYADKAKDEDRAAYAVSCLVEMYVVNKRVDEVFPLLPRLSGDTPAR